MTRMRSKRRREALERLLLRDGPRCRYCGKIPDEPTIDHVRPLQNGGTNRLENLVIACRGCNAAKSWRDAKKFKAKLLGLPNDQARV